MDGYCMGPAVYVGEGLSAMSEVFFACPHVVESRHAADLDGRREAEAAAGGSDGGVELQEDSDTHADLEGQNCNWRQTRYGYRRSLSISPRPFHPSGAVARNTIRSARRR